MKLSRRLFFSGCLLLAGVQLAGADPFDEIAAASDLPPVDRAQVEKGEIFLARGTTPGLPRMQIIESVFLVEAPPGKTVESWSTWNGTRQGDLKVYLHGEIGREPGPATFRTLEQAPENGPMQALAVATARAGEEKSELQLSSEERAQAPAEKAEGRGLSPRAAGFWSSILAGRARAFRQGGLPTQRSYHMGAQKIVPAQELASLLAIAPKAAAYFRPLLVEVGLGGAPSPRANLGWELGNVNGTAALSLGASAATATQTADLQFYASGGAYTVLTVQQLWPAPGAARPATLVWRIDFISAGPLGELRGLERTVAASTLSKEIRRLIASFQKEAAAH